MVSDNRCDVLCISETWLNEDISDQNISLNGYTFLRNDRVGARGGGVGIYYKSYLKSKIVLKSFGSSVEYLFIELNDLSQKCLVGCVYSIRFR